MNKKLIEVLETIAQGKRIRFICDGYEYHTDEAGRILDNHNELANWYVYKQWLNEEVEIIEYMPKKIEKITPFEAPFLKDDGKPDLRFQLIIYELNKIIDYINKGQDNEDI